MCTVYGTTPQLRGCQDFNIVIQGYSFAASGQSNCQSVELFCWPLEVLWQLRFFCWLWASSLLGLGRPIKCLEPFCFDRQSSGDADGPYSFQDTAFWTIILKLDIFQPETCCCTHLGVNVPSPIAHVWYWWPFVRWSWSSISETDIVPICRWAMMVSLPWRAAFWDGC